MKNGPNGDKEEKYYPGGKMRQKMSLIIGLILCLNPLMIENSLNQLDVKYSSSNGDSNEPNDSPGSATPIWQPSSGNGTITNQNLTIHITGDEDWFEINVNQSSKIEIFVGFSHSSGDLEATLYSDSNLSNILDNAFSLTDNETLSTTVPSSTSMPTTMYLKIYGYQNNVDNQTYNLSVDYEGLYGASIPKITDWTLDEFKINDFGNGIHQLYDEYLHGLAFGENESLWASGQFCSPWGSGTVQSCSMTHGSVSNTTEYQKDGLVMHRNSLGTWANQFVFGTEKMDSANAIIPISESEAYVAGYYCHGAVTADQCSMSMGSQNFSSETGSGMIFKADYDGNLSWFVDVTSTKKSTIHDVAINNVGGPIAHGIHCIGGDDDCSSSIYGNTDNLNSVGAADGFIVSINPDGTVRWITNYSSQYNDYNPSSADLHYADWDDTIVNSPAGGHLIAGSICQFASACGTTTFGEDFEFDINTRYDSFVGHIDDNGSWTWVELINSTDSGEYIKSISVIDENRIVVIGSFTGGSTRLGNLNLTGGGGSDGFFGIFNFTSQIWESGWATKSQSNEYFDSVAVSNERIIIGGSFCRHHGTNPSACTLEVFNEVISTSSNSAFFAEVDASGIISLDMINASSGYTLVTDMEADDNGDLAISGLVCWGFIGGCSMSSPIQPTQYIENGTFIGLYKSDSDRDGILDSNDDCFSLSYWTSNFTTDRDGDGCNDIIEDLDDDNDGYPDNIDGCVLIYGTSTEDRNGCHDTDRDGFSDPDSDWSYENGADRFPNDPLQWADGDGDGYGDNAYWDINPNNGLRTNQTGDAVPNNSYQWTDADGDGFGDTDIEGMYFDDCPLIFGTSNQSDIFGCADSDGDGYADSIDDFPANSTQWSDQDGDGFGDNPLGDYPDFCPSTSGNSSIGGLMGCPDSDSDGWPDSYDSFPNDSSQWNDTDQDGYGDHVEGINPDGCVEEYGNSTIPIFGCPDSDGDGRPDSTDAFPLDITQWEDEDGDGYGDNPDGTEPDECPLTPGTSYLDVFGCSDYDNDGWSGLLDKFPFDQTQWFDSDNDGFGDNGSGEFADNCPTIANGVSEDNQADYDTDGLGNACDNDDDNDGIDDEDDRCPTGEKDWTSESIIDFDNDGCMDSLEDEDDDNDGISDQIDTCKRSNILFVSSPQLDHDSDGCHDTEEDTDDDEDGVIDAPDQCPVGITGWRSTSGVGGTDYDADGCKDDSEDLDDDNDGILDELDSCPIGFTGWDGGGPNDLDQDGCIDGLESVDNQGNEVADNQYLLDLINQSQDEEKTFIEAVSSGDLDAIGLVFAAFLPIIGIGTTLLFRVRKGAFVRGLERTIQIANTVEDLEQAKKDIRRAAKNDQISTNRYELMMDDLNDRQETILREKESTRKKRKKSPPKKSPPKKSPPKKSPPKNNASSGSTKSKSAKTIESQEEFSLPPEDEITTGDDGYRYWEDQNGQWWIEMNDEWTQWG